MNLERAVAFVKDKGNEVEHARLARVLANECPSQEVVAKLFTGQRPDGGWPPFWVNDYSSLDATCFRLAQAEQVGVPEHETAIARALRFLAQRQSSDGSWEEERTVARFAPSWARPGDPSARLYLTANCGLWLALSGDREDEASRAANYLLSHLTEEGRLPSFLHTHWLAAALWHKLGRIDASDRALEYLGRRIDDLAAGNLPWLITAVCAAGVTTNHPLVERAASLLAQGQQDDGRWASEDGPSHDVHSTLEAIRALRLCGRAVKQLGAAEAGAADSPSASAAGAPTARREPSPSASLGPR